MQNFDDDDDDDDDNGSITYQLRAHSDGISTPLSTDITTRKEKTRTHQEMR